MHRPPMTGSVSACTRRRSARLSSARTHGYIPPKAVIGVLDALDVRWGILVGDRAGAELAWELAATRLDRFTGLVVIDRGTRVFPTRTAWSATRIARRWRSTPPRWSVRPPHGHWPGPASATSTATTDWWSSPGGATPRSPPRSWPRRSCYAPAPGELSAAARPSLPEESTPAVDPVGRGTGNPRKPVRSAAARDWPGRAVRWLRRTRTRRGSRRAPAGRCP